MAKDKIENVIMEIILATLQLLLGSSKSNERKNIRQSFRNYKKVKKLMKKSDGISEKEKEQLEILVDALVHAQGKLLKSE